MTTAAAPTTRGSHPLAISAAIAVVLAWYLYVGWRANPGWLVAEPSRYYDRLTEAFVSGQTHWKMAPDPRLAELANPWAGAQGIPRVHDATYFNGRYYLYFGAAPVVLLFAPWRLLTGTYLSDGTGTVVFCAAGFLLALGYFARCRRRFFPELSAAWTAAAAVSLGLGAYIQFEFLSPEFYNVPIACAFACGMGCAHALLSAGAARREGAQAAGLALASAAAALAVGARPGYLPALAVVGIAAVALRKPRLLIAAVVPAASIGVAIALYNYQRFGSILESGIRYQFAAVDMRTVPLFRFAHIPDAFASYFFAGKEYQGYFPFIRQSGANLGLVPWAPLALVGLAFPVTLAARRFRATAWLLGPASLFAIAVINLGTLLGYYYFFDRYVLDFLPYLVLVAWITAGAAAVSVAEGRTRRWLALGLGALAGFTLVHSGVRGFPTSREYPEVRWVSRALNSAAEKLRGGAAIGSVLADVEFKPGTAGVSEPLVSTGQGKDVIYVRYLGASRAQIGFFHRGSGGPLSDPFEFETGKTYRLTADLGSLYPALDNPRLDELPADTVRSLMHRVDVRLDGRSLLRFDSAFHGHDPASVELGVNSANDGSRMESRFRGAIRSAGRGGLPSADSSTLDTSGPVRLRVRLPPFVAPIAQPLISSGRTAAGDLLYIFYVGPNQVRFGHDSWSRGLFETEIFTCDPAEVQTIDIDMGSLHPVAAGADRADGRLRIRFNGRIAADLDRPFHPSSTADIAIGHNAIGASTSETNFSGARLAFERLPSFPPAPTAGEVVMTIRMPRQRIDRSEPLVTTGANGAGDLVYIRFTDSEHFRIGFDHWGKGGPVSEPVRYDPGAPVVVQVTLGALYPGGRSRWGLDPGAVDDATWARLLSTVRVVVDGKEVLRFAGPSHPATESQVYVGENRIGASLADPMFTGTIVKVERAGAPGISSGDSTE